MGKKDSKSTLASVNLATHLQNEQETPSLELLTQELLMKDLLYKIATGPFFLGINYSVDHVLAILCHEFKFEVGHWYWTKNLESSTLKSGDEWKIADSKNQDFKNFKKESDSLEIANQDLFEKENNQFKVIVLNQFIESSLSRIKISSITCFKTALFIPFFHNEELQGFLELFSVEQKLISTDAIHFFQKVGIELSRQLQILKNQEVEKQQVFQLAQASRLSSLGAMAGGIAHEINNPLTIILGSIKMADRFVRSDSKDPNDKKKSIEALEKAKSYTERIAKIVKGIRAMSRDGAHDPFIFAKTKDILEDTLNLCEARIKTNNIQLTFEIDDEDLLIQCRPIQISQVLLNLINNSMDAIGEDPTAWIHIKTEKISEEFVEFSITDCGLGIPESVAHQLMQPFFTTKGAGRGTGLGLSISKEIIKTHSGEFYLNKDFKNTQFIIKLPIVQKNEN